MRALIMGSGWIGGVFGARLARGGADVTFVARGAHLDAMRKDGLRIEGGADPIAPADGQCHRHPGGIGRVDMILFAVKLWDTESAARSLLPCLGPDTGLISFQNGVQKDDMLRPIVGDGALALLIAYDVTTGARVWLTTYQGLVSAQLINDLLIAKVFTSLGASQSRASKLFERQRCERIYDMVLGWQVLPSRCEEAKRSFRVLSFDHCHIGVRSRRARHILCIDFTRGAGPGHVLEMQHASISGRRGQYGPGCGRLPRREVENFHLEEAMSQPVGGKPISAAGDRGLIDLAP